MNVRELILQAEVLHPSVIVTNPQKISSTSFTRAVTLFDLYFDQERPFIIGEASKLVGESVELLNTDHEAKLSVETYCDRRKHRGIWDGLELPTNLAG